VEKFEKVKKEELLQDLLNKKNTDLDSFCDLLSPTHFLVRKKAQLISPLITGIGESHPGEVGMVFDHSLGIPYLPASGIKGVHRLLFTVEGIKSLSEDFLKKESVEERDIDEDIPAVYGSNEDRGKVIFLDTYPEKVPELHVDIMNPHYNRYYQSDKKRVEAPRDNENPVPIQFLVVKPGTVFTFRVLVAKTMYNSEAVRDKIEKALLDILENGVGAKTSIGYGRFQVVSDSDTGAHKEAVRPRIEYEMGSGHMVEIVNVTEKDIRVRTPDGIESPIGKKKARSGTNDDLPSLYKIGQRIHVKVIGENKKGEPQFKVDR
jgi:CRISPR-associated protein Cmr6